MNAETLIQNQIRIALSAYGICVRLNTGYFRTDDDRIVKCGLTGLPDLLLIRPDGRVAWLEVKTATGVESDDQKRFIARMQEMGTRLA